MFFWTLLLLLLLLLLFLFICGHSADIIFLLVFPFSSCDVFHLSFSHRCAGTTAVVCIVRGGHLWCATLGDSVAMLGRADDPLVSEISNLLFLCFDYHHCTSIRSLKYVAIIF